MEGAEENGHTMFHPCKSLVMEGKKRKEKIEHMERIAQEYGSTCKRLTMY